MKNQRNYTRKYVGLILALLGLTTFVLGPARLGSAQAGAPSWNYTGNLNTARIGHTATLLPNGKVLVAGGFNAPVYLPDALNSAELYDPATGTWSSTGNLNTGRYNHTATLLQNGKVLVAGGGYGTYAEFDSAELYDPATGAWTYTGSLAARAGHTATLLQNGKVLVAGGGYCYGDCSHSSAELYDSATGTWSSTGSLSTSRGSHVATLLPNGKVLVAGGYNMDYSNGALNSAELYDQASGSWSLTGTLNTARFSPTSTLLPSGKVLVDGGFNNSGEIFNNSAELYDLATGTWSSTGNLNTSRHSYTATLLPNGKVLVAAGSDNNGAVIGADLYDPTTGTCSITANLNTGRYGHTATLLPDGKVLVAGGGDTNSTALKSAELYDPGTAPNPIDDPRFFVRQHYLDFLNREPDGPGWDFWTGEITECNDPAKRQPGESPAACTGRKRDNTSAAFFLSPEFQNTGSFVLRVYWGTLGKLPSAQCGLPNGLLGSCRPLFSDYVADINQVAQGIVVNDQLAPDIINANKRAFVDAFVNKPAFKAKYDGLTNAQVVDTLFATTGVIPSEADRTSLINGLNSGTETRSSVVFKVVDGTRTLTDGALVFETSYGKAFFDQEFDAAFVFMEYIGYLRRNPDQEGFDFWLAKLKRYGNWVDAEMVRSFIVSPEYRSRFGQP